MYGSNIFNMLPLELGLLDNCVAGGRAEESQALEMCREWLWTADKMAVDNSCTIALPLNPLDVAKYE